MGRWWRAAGAALTLLLVAGCTATGGGATSAAGGGATSTAAPTPAAGGGGGTSATASSGGGGAGTTTGGPVAAGDDLCGLLGPADFAAAGLTGTGKPTENNQDNSNVYCVYAGKSAATGGVEFDAFLAASSADSEASFNAVAAPMLDFEGAGKAAFPGANDAKIRTDMPDGYAAIAIWDGKLVFDIGIPPSDHAKDRLIALAKLVLDRAKGLT